MSQREFHIWDFPEDKTRILFRNHKKFINNAINFFGSQIALGNFLNITPGLLSRWKRDSLYIPLSNIKKIVNELQLDWIKLEEDIIAYKGINTISPIFNPRLPIKENPEIFELITHIICDGSVNKNGIPAYINSEKVLISNFAKILENNFGKMPTKLYSSEKSNKICYEYCFPKIIAELLEYFYNFSFYKANKFPSVFLDLPKKSAVSVIRAFADDEGSVDLNRRICFSSINKNLLDLLVILLKEKLNYTNITEIKLKDKDYYYFYIKPKDIERYQKEIGFMHPKRKDKLREIVFSRKTGYKPGQHSKNGLTNEKILKLLDGKTLSTYDLVKEIKINKSNINTQVKRLRDQNLIVQHHKEGQTIFLTRRKN